MFDVAPQELSAVHIAQACQSDLALPGSVSLNLHKPDFRIYLFGNSTSVALQAH